MLKLCSLIYIKLHSPSKIPGYVPARKWYEHSCGSSNMTDRKSYVIKIVSHSNFTKNNRDENFWKSAIKQKNKRKRKIKQNENEPKTKMNLPKKFC